MSYLVHLLDHGVGVLGDLLCQPVVPRVVREGAEDGEPRVGVGIGVRLKVGLRLGLRLGSGSVVSGKGQDQDQVQGQG